MFKISLPVQRFVIGCIILMLIVMGADVLMNEMWSWNDLVQNTMYHLPSSS
jgi:hypothetical protein